MINTVFDTSMKDQSLMLQRKFRRMPLECQLTVRRAFERHRRACEKIACNIDPHFLLEVVMDAGKVRV